MITITQPQIDAICWAAERHVRSLRRSCTDQEQEIKEIRGWIAALKCEKCQLSFVRLANLLKMYPIKQLRIDFFKYRSDYTQLESVIRLVVQQTKTLERIFLNANSFCFDHDFRGLDKLVSWLSVFERIDHFKFYYSSASTEALKLIASLPINSLCFCTDHERLLFSSFIRANKTIEHLELFSYYNHLPSETLEALKENRTLKVGHFSHSEATISHILVIKDRHTLSIARQSR